MGLGAYLKAVLTLNATGFHSEMSKAGKGVDGFTNQLAGLKSAIASSFAVYAVAAWVKSVKDNVTSIKDLAEQTNLTTTQVQQLQVASSKVGLKFEDMARAINKVRDARKEAVTSGGAAAEAFAKLGISTEMLNDSSVSELEIMQRMADALSQGTLSTAELNTVQEILGTRLVKVAAAMKEMKAAEGIAVIDEDQIKRIDALDKKWTEFWRRWRVASAELADTLVDLGDRIYNGPRFVRRPGSKPIFNPALPPSPGLTTEPTKPPGPPLYSKTALTEARKKDEAELLKESYALQQKLFKLQLDQMTPAEKKIELQYKYNQLLKDATELQLMGYEADAQKKYGEAADVVGQLAGLAKPKDYQLHLSRLQQIGGYAGPAGLRPQQTINEVREIKTQVKIMINTLDHLREDVRNGGIY